jgi:hypothetical protein
MRRLRLDRPAFDVCDRPAAAHIRVRGEPDEEEEEEEDDDGKENEDDDDNEDGYSE